MVRSWSVYLLSLDRHRLLDMFCHTVTLIFYVASSFRVHRATKVIKPLERILLDNGIVFESARTSKSKAAADDMDVEVEFEQPRLNNSSSSSNMKGRGSTANLNTLSGSRNASSSNLKAASSSASLNYQYKSADEFNYHTIAAKSSALPARQCFCSVCRYIGHDS